MHTYIPRERKKNVYAQIKIYKLFKIKYSVIYFRKIGTEVEQTLEEKEKLKNMFFNVLLQRKSFLKLI